MFKRLIIITACIVSFVNGDIQARPGPDSNYNIAISGGGGGITFVGTDAQSVTPAFGAGTFPSVNIDSASFDRIVMVCWVQDSGGGIAAPTYSIGSGGSGGTAFTNAAGNSTTADNAALYYANITSGTVITIAFPGGAAGISIAVGILKGQSGGGGASATNPTVYTGGGAQPLSISLTVPSGGIGVACASSNTGGAVNPTYTWTGTTSSTGDETTGVTTTQMGLAHSIATGTITASSSATLSFIGTMAAASWAP